MKNRYVLLADLMLIIVAAAGAFVGRYDLALRYHPEFIPYVLSALVVKPAVFLLAGMYRRYWRYASVRDFTMVALAVTVSSAAMALVVVAAHSRLPDGFSRVIILNDWLMTLATIGGLRIAIRVVHDATTSAAHDRDRLGFQRDVLIVGAGAAGTMVAREMRRNPQLGMKPRGFLDDHVEKIGKYLGELRVLGNAKSLPDVVRTHQISHVVIAMPTASGKVIRSVLNSCRKAGVTYQTVPGIYELLGGSVSVNRLRTVEIEDLLRRAPITGRGDAVEVVADRVVLITGAGGSIGSELARQVATASPSELVLLGHGENSLFEAESRLRATFSTLRLRTVVADTRDRHRLAVVFERARPDVVFHAAAHKHVPLMEENPEESVTNNVLGTRNVVEQALRVGTDRLVLISTDKAVSPTSVMGATKRLAEAVVKQAAQRSGRAFVVVRFGNVLGSRGSVVQTFKEQIAQGVPITITHPEMTRFFMTIPEAVHLVLLASGAASGGELFVLDMGEPVKIVDLARDLITLSGLEEDECEIVFTGVRPGEKIHERLFDEHMVTERTAHPDVLRVLGDDPVPGAELDATVAALEAASRRGDRETIQVLLAQAVPGFTPSTDAADGHRTVRHVVVPTTPRLRIH